MRAIPGTPPTGSERAAHAGDPLVSQGATPARRSGAAAGVGVDRKMCGRARTDVIVGPVAGGCVRLAPGRRSLGPARSGARPEWRPSSDNRGGPIPASFVAMTSLPQRADGFRGGGEAVDCDAGGGIERDPRRGVEADRAEYDGWLAEARKAAE